MMEAEVEAEAEAEAEAEKAASVPPSKEDTKSEVCTYGSPRIVNRVRFSGARACSRAGARARALREDCDERVTMRVGDGGEAGCAAASSSNSAAAMLRVTAGR